MDCTVQSLYYTICSESVLHIRWTKHWSFSFIISPSNEHPGLTSFRMDWLISSKSKGLSRVVSSTTVQKHQFFGAQLALWSNSLEKTIALTIQTFKSKAKQNFVQLLSSWIHRCLNIEQENLNKFVKVDFFGQKFLSKSNHNRIITHQMFFL